MIKKAGFTVEAAYIVPLMLVFIAGLLGFTYFTHHLNWCRGAAYESVYYALQRSPEVSDPGESASRRLSDRILEIPLDVSDISSEVKTDAAGLSAETESSILPELFGGLFTLKQGVSAVKIDAPEFKRAAWIMNYIKELSGT